MIKHKDVMEKLDEYLKDVTLEQLNEDLEKAGMNFYVTEKQDAGSQSALTGGLVGLCGCGRPVRYMIRGTEGSCNKYMRCLTREELGDTLVGANKIIAKLRKALENIAEYEGATATGANAERVLSETAS